MVRVLIVDDASFMRLKMRMIMEKNGFVVVGEAENGRKAIEKYAELKPDVVTMDITMPEMTGVEALTHIMKLDSNAKIIMVTAIGQESMVREAIMNGAKAFIIKPFEDIRVVQAIQQLTGL